MKNRLVKIKSTGVHNSSYIRVREHRHLHFIPLGFKEFVQSSSPESALSVNRMSRMNH